MTTRCPFRVGPYSPNLYGACHSGNTEEGPLENTWYKPAKLKKKRAKQKVQQDAKRKPTRQDVCDWIQNFKIFLNLH